MCNAWNTFFDRGSTAKVFSGEKYSFTHILSFSDSVDSQQLLRTLPRVEVREGLSVSLGNHRKDEDCVEGGDDGKVEEDSARTKQSYEWFSELEKVLTFSRQLSPGLQGR